MIASRRPNPTPDCARCRAVPRRSKGRAIFVGMYLLFPSILDAITVVKPETVIGFASARLSRLLALEIPPARWQPQD